MKPLFRYLLILLLSQSCFSKPIADWAKYTGTSDSLGSLQKLNLNQCLPDAKKFKIPVHPSAKVVAVFWVGDRPVCKDNTKSSDKEINTVIFLSKLPLEVITKYYDTELKSMGFFHYKHHPGYSPGDNPEWAKDPYMKQKRPSEIFLRKKLDQFIWNRDIDSAPYVIIQDAKKPFNESGYKTSIEIYEPAL